MANRRDLVSEIEEIRARRAPGSHAVTIPFRMLVLANAFRSSPDLNPEFLRYLPVGTVACIEGFVRSAIKECIDAGEPFVTNAKSLGQARDLRVDFDLLRAVHGRRITVGDLVAHLLPINGLAQIESIMTTILGRSFLETVKTIHSRWDVEIKREPLRPIIAEPDVVLKHVEEMFRLRHIFAHELALVEDLNREDIAVALESSVAFLKAGAEVIARSLHRDAPLTQADMNQRAAQDRVEVERSIQTEYSLLAATIRGDRLAQLEASQASWAEYQRRQADFRAGSYAGGTIYPLIHASEARKVALVRLEELREMRSAEEGDY